VGPCPKVSRGVTTNNFRKPPKLCPHKGFPIFPRWASNYGHPLNRWEIPGGFRPMKLGKKWLDTKRLATWSNLKILEFPPKDLFPKMTPHEVESSHPLWAYSTVIGPYFGVTTTCQDYTHTQEETNPNS